MKFAVQKNHLGGQILDRISDIPKKRRHETKWLLMWKKFNPRLIPIENLPLSCAEVLTI